MAGNALYDVGMRLRAAELHGTVKILSQIDRGGLGPALL